MIYFGLYHLGPQATHTDTPVFSLSFQVVPMNMFLAKPYKILPFCKRQKATKTALAVCSMPITFLYVRSYVCHIRTKCLSVAPELLTLQYNSITHLTICTRSDKRKNVEILSTTPSHCTQMADSVQWLSQSDGSICVSILVEFY